ncbi:hypothetical protein KP509_20G031500 [Ceratopteris richardii]|uniref:AB hydrolase-1 domain-containing protein n=1 Tax=Ceratopteris richardii TaxID=49495 RepID=A0A8T2SGC1_CERRI|nr:hypothetical protein KP509_20G031500 [Ceratopteris richardii]
MATVNCSLRDQIFARESLAISPQRPLAPPRSASSAGSLWQSRFSSTLLSSSHASSSSSIAGQRNGFAVFAQLVQTESASARVKPQSKTWTWKRDQMKLNISYEEHVCSEISDGPLQTLILLPSISDVSTTEEWRQVAFKLLGRDGSRWRIVIVDWPGFGLSDRPRMEYTADVMEGFLKDFLTSSDSPISMSVLERPPAIVGAGHAATLAMRAVKKGLINAQAIVAVAPTWAGPMPIVFGREPDMESRYNLLRGSLQAPALGWMMYNFMVSSPDNIRKQYLSHVYADPNNVTPSLLESRLALTKREGARFAPAAFLTGLLDPVTSREDFLSLVADLEGKSSVLIAAASQAPKRSKAEMLVLNGARGVSKYVEVNGGLLPQEEYPEEVSEVIYDFLADI